MPSAKSSRILACGNVLTVAHSSAALYMVPVLLLFCRLYRGLTGVLKGNRPQTRYFRNPIAFDWNVLFTEREREKGRERGKGREVERQG